MVYWKEWRAALKRSSPLLISATLAGMVFGALVIASGLTVLDGLVMSGFIYSGAAQFVGLQLIITHAGLTAALATTFMLSMRFFLYAISLIDEVKQVPIKYRVVLAFGLIDAVFVLANQRFSEAGTQAEKNSYFMACVVIFYLNWIIGTLLGLWLGDALSKYTEAYGLEFFTYATFAAMLAPYLKSRKNQIVAIIALTTYLISWSAPYNLAILISCVIAVLLVTAAYSFRGKKSARDPL